MEADYKYRVLRRAVWYPVTNVFLRINDQSHRLQGVGHDLIFIMGLVAHNKATA